MGTRGNFVRSVTRPAAQINLALSCFYIAAERSPEIDIARNLGEICRLAERVHRPKLSRALRYDQIYAVNDVLFGEAGFRGNSSDYYDLRNSLLDEVLERRLGIPITLSIVYLEVAKRVGLRLTGVNMAGHFLLRAGTGVARVYIDPFREGRIYSRWECLRLLRGLGNPPHQSDRLDRLERGYLPAASNRQILARVLNNMKVINTHRDDLRAAIADAERIQHLMPRNWRNVGDMAHLYGRAGHVRDAYHALAQAVEMMPANADVSSHRDALEMLRPLAESEEIVDPAKIHEIPFFRM